MEQRLLDEKAKLEAWFNSPEYQARLMQRLQVNDACLRNPEAKALTYGLCKDDPVFFVEMFGWTYDPRPEHAPHHLPFIMFPFQKDALLWIIEKIRNGGDGLMDKSRDMGATWLFVWAFYYCWRFDDSFSGLVGSYKQDLVDNRTQDSLFGKFDYCLQNTPKWLLPRKFKVKDHRQSMKLINPESGNLITGDTMNPDFSRGSRKTAVFFDEGASWEYFREAWESAGDSTPCRLTCSTPKGRNAFALLRESGIDYISLHWSKHPFKDQAWYEAEKVRRTEEEVAQELDISYNKSQEGRVYPEWDTVIYGFHPYDRDLPLWISWDFGHTDDTAIIWWQKTKDGKLVIVDAYSNRGKLIDYYVPFITGIMPSNLLGYSKRDVEVINSHSNWSRGIHFGDPAGRFTNQVTNTSVMDVLKTYGINVNFREEAKDFATRKTASKLLMRNLVVNDNPRTKDLGISMENSKYPVVRRGGQEDVKSLKPVHDWSSHYRSAFEYFAVNYGRFSGRVTIRDKFPVRERNPNKVSGY